MVEHRLHKRRCGCGATTTATAPAGVGATAVYGPNLRALAVYLLVFQHIPVARTAALIADLTGARPSTGWISSVLSTVAEVLIDVEKLIKSLIMLAHVIHVDETSSNINGARWWLHVAPDKLTAYHLHPSRGRTRWPSSTCCPTTAAPWSTTRSASMTSTSRPAMPCAARTWPVN